MTSLRVCKQADKVQSKDKQQETTKRYCSVLNEPSRSLATFFSAALDNDNSGFPHFLLVNASACRSHNPTCTLIHRATWTMTHQYTISPRPATASFSISPATRMPPVCLLSKYCIIDSSSGHRIWEFSLRRTSRWTLA